MENIFLSTAKKIGNRLVETAMYKDNYCTWGINTPDRSNPRARVAKKETASTGLYQGTTGIALFLIELYGVSGEKKYIDVAERALNLTLSEVNGFPENSFALHGGRIGEAYTLFRFYKITEREEYLNYVFDIVKPLVGKEREDKGIDVISGAGGAIPVLLKMYQESGEKLFLEIAVNLGENLIKIANKEIYGWSWCYSYMNYRNLCGFAHGASGIGHAFLELYNVTQNSKYLYAAEQAFLYERQFLSSENNNWPDFRYSDFSEYIYNNEMDKLRELVHTNKLVPYTTKYMSAWCHGSPGIALARLRMYELLPEEKNKTEILSSLDSTIRSVYNQQGNYSLCHGLAGNCEPLIIADKYFPEAGYKKIAEDCALAGIESYENKNIHWPCGTLNGVNDPSLMLGEAGTGMFMLRLFDENIPSILLPTTRKAKNFSLNNEQILESRQEYIEEFWHRTIKMDNLNIKEILPEFITGDDKSDIITIKKFLEVRSKSFNDMTNEVFRFENDLIKVKENLTDFSAEYINTIRYENISEDVIINSNLRLNKTCRLFESLVDIDSFISGDNEIYYLIHTLGEKVVYRKINEFIFALLDCIGKNKSFADVYNEFKGMMEVADENGILRQKLLEQIKVLVLSNILSLEESEIKNNTQDALHKCTEGCPHKH